MTLPAIDKIYEVTTTLFIILLMAQIIVMAAIFFASMVVKKVRDPHMWEPDPEEDKKKKDPVIP